MSNWPSAKAKRVLAALHRIGWSLKRQSGSHKTLERSGSQSIADQIEQPHSFNICPVHSVITQESMRESNNTQRLAIPISVLSDMSSGLSDLVCRLIRG